MNPITNGAPIKSPPRYAFVQLIEIAANTQPMKAATTTASVALANVLFGIQRLNLGPSRGRSFDDLCSASGREGRTNSKAKRINLSKGTKNKMTSQIGARIARSRCVVRQTPIHAKGAAKVSIVPTKTAEVVRFKRRTENCGKK